MSLDIDRTFSLLHIIDLAKQWPGLRGIHDRAMKDLTKHSQALYEELVKEKVEEEKALAAKKAEAEARIRAQAQADEKVEELRLQRARAVIEDRKSEVIPGIYKAPEPEPEPEIERRL